MKTNKQRLTKMVKELSDFELAILRERLWTMAENVLANEQEVRDEMKDGFITADVYINTMKNVLKHVSEAE